MWIANNDPERDRANILELFDNIKKANADTLVLISTISVYEDTSDGPDENSSAYESSLAYGRHRREFESLIEDHFERHLILRLPALFGYGLKKNFIFDLINPIPSFLKPNVWEQINTAAQIHEKTALDQCFSFQDDISMWRFDREKAKDHALTDTLEKLCRGTGDLARNFTNSESRYQFYSLKNLWRDIERGLDISASHLNLASEPIPAEAIAEELSGDTFQNDKPNRISQNMKSFHARAWGHDHGYLYSEDEVMSDLRAFYLREREQV